MAHTALLHPSRRRALLGFGALCAAPTLLLTGCFSEPKERKAFIEFLDKGIEQFKSQGQALTPSITPIDLTSGM